MDLDRFALTASREPDPQAAVQEVLARAIATPKAVLAALGEPEQAAIRTLHRSKTLTIFSATWTPQMNLVPHIRWRRTPGRVEGFGAKALFEGDVAVLPADVIHSVTNPRLRFTGGIHIDGGDFFDTTCSQWDPETLAEERSDGARIREMFERENDRLAKRW